MPHRVADFFRSSNDSIAHTIKESVQRRRSPSSRQPTNNTSRAGSTRSLSYASSIDEEAEQENSQQPQPQTGLHLASIFAPPVRMPESAKEKEHHKEHHRLSFPALPHIHLGGSKSSKDHTQHSHASLDWKIESPPAVLHGDPDSSTGALVSGQLLLAVKEEPFEVESFTAKLNIHIIQKKPYQHHCSDCTNQTTELKSWSFLTEPTALTQRLHEFPFSALLEGHLPASTDNSLLAVRYDFTAEVKPKNGSPLKLLKTINVKRSLPVPEVPHHSVRIFPPTNIAASVHYPQVIHPIGSSILTLRLDGIVKSNTEVKTVEYWKLKRISWKVEEHLNTVAPACPKHAPKDADNIPDAAGRKGMKRTETRTVGSADLSSGWKSDYSPNGNVEMEIEYGCNPNSKAVCDMKSRDGTEITHQLVVEMVVVQEYAPVNQPRHVTPTGVARILRMHFGTVVTERAGLGISWDEEAPPIYQDVPPSPPSYLCEIPYKEFEGLSELHAAQNSDSEDDAR